VIVHLLFLGAFNIVFFVLKGTDNLPSVWISYGAIHLAYVLVWGLPFTGLKRADIFGISSTVILHIYFWIEFVVGIVFISVEPQSWEVAFVVQLIVLCIFVAAALLGRIGGHYAQEGEPMRDELARNTKQTDYVKLAQTKLDILRRGTLDMGLKNHVTEVTDFFTEKSLGPEKNTLKLMNYTTQFVTAVGSKDQKAVEAAKKALLDYVL